MATHMTIKINRHGYQDPESLLGSHAVLQCVRRSSQMDDSQNVRTSFDSSVTSLKGTRALDRT